MKTILLTHTDLDGLGAKIVLDYFNFKYDDFLYCDYDQFNNNYEKLLNFDKVVCTDYSLSTDLVKILLDAGKLVEIYDHHESSEILKSIIHENFKLIHDMSICGTKIVFNSFKENKRYKKSLYQFVDLVDTYDLFNEKSSLWEDAQNMNRILWYSVQWDEPNRFKFITEYWLTKLEKESVWSWTNYELNKIKRALQVENEEYIKSKVSFKIRKDSKGRSFGVTVAPRKVSIVANRLLKDFPEIDYIAVINTYEGWNKISLRSRDPNVFNCTQIANGHACAAGLEIGEKEARAFYKGAYQLNYKEDLNE